MDCRRLKYKFLYNFKYQMILFLKIYPEASRYANEILITLDDTVGGIGKEVNREQLVKNVINRGSFHGFSSSFPLM